MNNGGGSSNFLSTIILNNTNTGTSYTDTSPTDGSIYSYCRHRHQRRRHQQQFDCGRGRAAARAAGAAPGSLTATFAVNQHHFELVSGFRARWDTSSAAATSVNGSFTLLQSITETTYTDYGLNTNTTYYYKVTPVNAGGMATNGISTTRPAAPAGLTAVAGNAQVTLTWPASIGATGYLVLRGTGGGNATNTIASGITATNYTDTALTNGVTYFYVVEAIGTAATSGDSPAARATPAIPNLIWTGAASAVWNTTATNWLNGVAAVAYADGNNVIFDDTTQTNITISGAVSPASVTFASTNAGYGVSATGAGISGATGLIKTNPGVLSLNNANGFAGGTTISGGTLLVNNATGSGTGSGAVTVANGGTLGGTGIISGAVTVNAGGTLAPGNPLGTLTISNNLTLAGGSAIVAQVQHAPLNNSVLVIPATLTNGGSLFVNGPLTLAAGDTFRLFHAAAYSSAFALVSLPPLPVGLAWNTNILNTAGTISVVVTATPAIGQLSISGNDLVFSGTGGVGGANYYLLGSTNLAAPLTNWTRLLTNQFDNSGNFDFTNTAGPDSPQQFYILKVQ